MHDTASATSNTSVKRGFRHDTVRLSTCPFSSTLAENFTLHVHLLHTLLPVYAERPCADINNYIELGGSVSASPLQLYYQPGATQPEAFAWLTQPGVYYGNFNWDTTQHSRELDHLKNHRLLPYSSSRSDAPTLPVSVVGAWDRPAPAAELGSLLCSCVHCAFVVLLMLAAG